MYICDAYNSCKFCIIHLVSTKFKFSSCNFNAMLFSSHSGLFFAVNSLSSFRWLVFRWFIQFHVRIFTQIWHSLHFSTVLVYNQIHSRMLNLSSHIRADTSSKNISGAPLLFWSIKLLLIPVFLSGLLCPQQCQIHAEVLLSLAVPFSNIMYTTGGKWRFRLSRLSPDGGLWKALKCLQNVPWRMLNILLFYAVLFFSFNLTISLSLSPDCIRIDCNLSKCLLCLFTLTWFREHSLWYNHMPLALLPYKTQHN